jgi:hypothetical protein
MWVGTALWVTAVAVMLAAATYQRRTGPTYPYRGEVVIAGDTSAYELLRSEETSREARVEFALPPEADAAGALFFRRYPSDEPFTAVPMRRHGDTLVATLPVQPPAGKLEYRAELTGPEGTLRIPDGQDETVILRYKDPVPTALLLPHVLFMFFAMLVGVRAGLGALTGVGAVRRYSWVTLGLMTVGGLVLGPLTQKAAFGQLWTGWPNGYDLTDNKTLIMWLVWAVACAVLGRRGKGGTRERAGRAAVAMATLVMLAVYLVPHSLRGSELDYTQIEQGVDPADAIETGR